MQEVTVTKRSYSKTLDNLRADCEYRLKFLDSNKISVGYIIWFVDSTNPNVIYFTEPIRKITPDGGKMYCYSSGAKYTIINVNSQEEESGPDINQEA